MRTDGYSIYCVRGNPTGRHRGPLSQSRILLVALVVVAMFCHSCQRAQQLKAPYTVDKQSPQGTYRIKLELTPNPKRGSGIYERNEHLKIQYFKGQQVIATYETDSSDVMRCL